MIGYLIPMRLASEALNAHVVLSTLKKGGRGGRYTHNSCSLCQRAKAYQCVIFEFFFEAPRMQCKKNVTNEFGRF